MASWQVFAENIGISPEERDIILGIQEHSILKLAQDFRVSYELEQITVSLLWPVVRGRGEENPSPSRVLNNLSMETVEFIQINLYHSKSV